MYILQCTNHQLKAIGEFKIEITLKDVEIIKKNIYIYI